MAKGNHEAGKLVPVTLGKLGEGWHADGGNLYLFVRGGSRSWVFRYVGPDGKRKNMGLGPLSGVSLSEARKAAVSLRAQIKHPISPSDPLKDRQLKKVAEQMGRAKLITFRGCSVA